MTWQAVQWPIPLESQPTALVMGIGRHGENPMERYHLGDVWCLHLYRYFGEMRVKGLAFPICPGYASITPPFVELEHHFQGPSVHTVAHFSLPAVSDGAITIPAMQDLGEHFERLNADLEEAIGYFSTNRRRAEVRLWDVLWHLAGTANPADQATRLHPALQKTLQTIEMELSEPLSVAELADRVSLSHSHLTRLFRAAVGTTVIGYLRDRRVQRAQHLLVYSSLPVKAIAAQVGIPDLHLFNKTLRRALGRSPRQVRENKVQ